MSVKGWLLKKKDNMLLWYIFFVINIQSSSFSRVSFRVFFGQDEKEVVGEAKHILGSEDLTVKFSFEDVVINGIPLHKDVLFRGQNVESRSRILLGENIAKNKNNYKKKQLITKLIKLINKFGKKSINTLLPF